MGCLPPLSCEALSRIDRLAFERLGVPSAVLMENAGRGAANFARRFFDLRKDLQAAVGPVLVLAGGGNNGGDGFVLARHLAIAGSTVVLLDCASAGSRSADTTVFRGACLGLGIKIVSIDEPAALERYCRDSKGAALFVDGLLGTGFKSPLRAREAQLLETAGRFCKATTTPVLALDLPSGLEADSGRAAPEALTCAATVTFVAPKLGFCLRPATALVGTVEVVGIGLPERWMASIL
ncbi:MAG TPA: NAD(P)H-hydrate epimerase [Planctomycetes bacterium]|jgi:NAD(P)H-hydrate epimerase|nr:NAD(P)H-hydrate epimerase [Planctomycetota bacterium]